MLGLIKKLKTLPDAEQITDPQKVDAMYRHWRVRILYGSFIAYAVYYFCRVNISMALPSMEAELGYSKTELGLMVSALQIAYGIGKFVNGMMADRANPRYFMALGLFLSGLVNFFFGLSSSLIFLTVLWAINGWFQSMGFPAGARLLSHWYSPSEYGRIWGLYGCSHQVGAAVVLVSAGYLVNSFGWSYAFIVPAAVAMLVSLFVFNRLRDVPSTMGLPAIELYRREVTDHKAIEALEKPLSLSETLLTRVLNNKHVWFMAVGNFFLYLARYGALTWGPAFLNQQKGAAIDKAGWTLAVFEILGIAGMLSAGWVSDKFFRARRGPIMAMYMFLLSFGMLAFWLTPAGHPLVYTSALGICGFLIYGPLMLVSVAVVGFAGKKAAATVSGFTGLCGYIGAVVSGAGAGWVIDNYGWVAGFIMFIASGALSACCFALTWNVLPRSLAK